MQRIPLLTKDGSHTISVPELNVTYHSVHGAIQESMHVFIEAGLHYYLSNKTKDNISILEMGLGTGLNALLTMIEAEKLNLPVFYTALEAFPLDVATADSLNYCHLLNRNELKGDFIKLHECEWNKTVALSETVSLHKVNISLQNYEPSVKFDLVYYDAFAPAAQPELWTAEIFSKLFNLMAEGGVLVTYCSKGDVRRALQTAGFVVTKIPGPPGKREMLRAEKISGI